jgi:hypothetical protein
MMSVFTANDLQAADLLTLARLDDDGALPVVTPSRATLVALRRPAGSRPSLIAGAVAAGRGQACRAERVCGRR